VPPGVNRNPNVNTTSGPVPITANPPTISRRRMLVPGPVAPPPQQ
jgi:hypothetical protein